LQRYPIDDHLGQRTLLVAAAYVVLLRRTDARTEVLLQLRTGTGYMDGYWALVAGHVDPGESVYEAAVREAAEEAGITLGIDDLEAITALHRYVPGGDAVDQRVDLFFLARRWEGQPAVQEPDKTAAMGWFPLDELPDPVVPHERMVLDALAQGRSLPAVLVYRI
jgi:8-oxo-dGTP diphosphatase